MSHDAEHQVLRKYAVCGSPGVVNASGVRLYKGFCPLSAEIAYFAPLAAHLLLGLRLIQTNDLYHRHSGSVRAPWAVYARCSSQERCAPPGVQFFPSPLRHQRLLELAISFSTVRPQGGLDLHGTFSI